MPEIIDFETEAGRRFRFTVPIHPESKWGMNAVYSQSMHWAQRKKQAQGVHILVKSCIRKVDRNVRKFAKPVSVRITYDSRLDIDNHGYLAKLIIDGMKGVLVEDDTRRYIRELVQGFHTGAPNEIRVEVREI